MQSINRQMILGQVGRDPEIRETAAGKVASFSVATSNRYKTKSGEQKEETEWFNVVCWNKIAETAEKYVHKGDSIYVEGITKTRTYEKDGEKKSRTEVVAERLNLIGSKHHTEPTAVEAPAEHETVPADYSKDDLPF